MSTFEREMAYCQRLHRDVSVRCEYKIKNSSMNAQREELIKARVGRECLETALCSDSDCNQVTHGGVNYLPSLRS